MRKWQTLVVTSKSSRRLAYATNLICKICNFPLLVRSATFPNCIWLLRSWNFACSLLRHIFLFVLASLSIHWLVKSCRFCCSDCTFTQGSWCGIGLASRLDEQPSGQVPRRAPRQRGASGLQRHVRFGRRSICGHRKICQVSGPRARLLPGPTVVADIGGRSWLIQLSTPASWAVRGTCSSLQRTSCLSR